MWADPKQADMCLAGHENRKQRGARRPVLSREAGPSPVQRAARKRGALAHHTHRASASLCVRVPACPRVHLCGRGLYGVWGSDLRLTRGVRGVPLLPSSYGFPESPTQSFRFHLFSLSCQGAECRAESPKACYLRHVPGEPVEAQGGPRPAFRKHAAWDTVLRVQGEGSWAGGQSVQVKIQGMKPQRRDAGAPTASLETPRSLVTRDRIGGGRAARRARPEGLG